jgi:hypothetical protein
MKQRNLLFVLLVSYFALGIYTVYWLYQTRLEIVTTLQDERAIPRLRSVFYPALCALGIFLLVMLIIWGTRFRNNAVLALITLAFIASVAVAVVMGIRFLWFYCQALPRATKGTSGTTIFIIWVVANFIGLAPIGVLFAQNEINRYVETGAKPTATT